MFKEFGNTSMLLILLMKIGEENIIIIIINLARETLVSKAIGFIEKSTALEI